MKRVRLGGGGIAPSAIAALAACLFAGMAPAAEPVRITFLPPPLEGTLSAGIYTIGGKLVRTLAAEAREDAFTIGLNGLITSWDGNDDSGKPAAAGKYFVRGYSVGELQIEGSAYLGNDWVDADDVTIIREITAVKLDGRELLLEAKTVTGELGVVRLKLDDGERSYEPRAGTAGAPAVEAPGPDGSVWRIEEDAVIQHKGDEILRQLSFGPGEPKPFALAAAPDREELFLLERGPRGVRLRGLRLKQVKAEADGKAVSEWEVFLEKSIAAQATFEEAVPSLRRPGPPLVKEESVRVALVPNELLQVTPAAVNVSVAFDAKGSFLRTADGLLLRRISDTPNLEWAVLTRESDGTLVLFESNGAVIEEYHLQKLDQMMAFDAGEYDWAGAAKEDPAGSNKPFAAPEGVR